MNSENIVQVIEFRRKWHNPTNTLLLVPLSVRAVIDIKKSFIVATHTKFVEMESTGSKLFDWEIGNHCKITNVSYLDDFLIRINTMHAYQQRIERNNMNKATKFNMPNRVLVLNLSYSYIIWKNERTQIVANGGEVWVTFYETSVFAWFCLQCPDILNWFND